MLKSCQNVPSMTFMQISAAITEKHNFRYNTMARWKARGRLYIRRN